MVIVKKIIIILKYLINWKQESYNSLRFKMFLYFKSNLLVTIFRSENESNDAGKSLTRLLILVNVGNVDINTQ